MSFTEDDIKTVLDIALKSGVLEKTENTMMNKVFKFTDLATQEIMTPRPKIVAFPATVSYDELISKSKETGFSRFPIYKTDIDHIVGVLYMKDLLTLKMQNTDFLPQNVMRPPVFVLGSKKMSSLQEVLYESKQTLAIVIDEHAGTDGIVTQEDISKNIFGLSVDKKK
ncbi:MAG: CBS domain-containing protein [Treponema sp.]|nr:CBS domain-containing protein [Treponema sp.]